MRTNIEGLYASAWENAIDNTAKILNEKLGTAFNRRDNWFIIETMATEMNIQFDENGDLI